MIKRLLAPMLLLAGLAIAIIACTTQAQNTTDEQAYTTVEGARAERVNYRPTVFATGKLASAEAARLSFKTGGIIARIHVREGQRVRQGQVLADLALEEIQAQARQADLGEDQARIQLENARLALQLAERDYRNVKALYADSVATLEQYENVEVQLSNARNQLAAAEKGLAYSESGVKVARFNLRHSTIVAPTDGIILQQFAEVNELVGPGTPVFFFGSAQEAQVLEVAVTDKDIVHLNLGDTARVTFDAHPGHDFTAYVREMAANADPYTGTYEVELAMAPTSATLLNGFVGSALIQTSEYQDLIAIPVDGLLRANGEEGEVMVVSDSQATPRIIRIHHLEDDRLLLSGGLEAGEVVVSAGAGYLEAGDRVRLKNE